MSGHNEGVWKRSVMTQVFFWSQMCVDHHGIAALHPTGPSWWRELLRALWPFSGLVLRRQNRPRVLLWGLQRAALLSSARARLRRSLLLLQQLRPLSGVVLHGRAHYNMEHVYRRSGGRTGASSARSGSSLRILSWRALPAVRRVWRDCGDLGCDGKDATKVNLRSLINLFD